jgi:hypothetical protein
MQERMQGHAQPKDFERALNTAGVRLYSAVIEANLDPTTPEEQLGPTTLAEYAKATGGGTIALDQVSDARLDSTSKYIVDSILHTLILDLDIPETATGKLSIRYEQEPGKRADGVDVIYRKKLYPLAAAGR